MHLGRVQSERVFVVGLVDVIDDEGERRRIAQLDLELGIELVLDCRAVVAIAVGLEMRGIGNVVQVAELPAEFQASPPRVITAEGIVSRDRRTIWSVFGEYLYDSARVVPVKR